MRKAKPGTRRAKTTQANGDTPAMTTTLERTKPAPDKKAPPQRDFAIPRRPRPARPEPYKFDVHQYHAMAKAGILTSDDRVELIDGVIIAMSGTSPEHNATLNSSARFWVIRLGERAIAQIRGSVHLDDMNEPQPDIAILKPRIDFYRYRLPGVDDVLLVVEVSDTSLRHDRRTKLALYARFGVPEVWIANIPSRTIEAYTDPLGGEYMTRRTFYPGDAVSPVAFPDVALPVADVIGAAADEREE